jgi:hypothetical protein
MLMSPLYLLAEMLDEFGDSSTAAIELNANEHANEQVSCNNVTNLVDGEQTPCSKVIGKRPANKVGSDKVDNAEAGQESTENPLSSKLSRLSALN